MSKIHNAGTSLLAIINDILDFSKIEAGKLDIETTDFTAGRGDRLGHDASPRRRRTRRGSSSWRTSRPAFPSICCGDPLRLGQILTNLVNNAVKFTERGEIRRRRSSCSNAHGREGAAQVLGARHRHRHDAGAVGQAVPAVHAGRHVHDAQARRHRPGPDHLPAAGRADGRPHLARKRAGRRQHVLLHGLARRRRAERHGEDRSREAARSCACWSWTTMPPRARSCEEPLEHAWPAAWTPSRPAQEAIAAVQQHDAAEPYDIVFMDWRMPGMDGLQASRHIKSDETLTHPPAIVLVTAFGREEVREEAERLQLDGFLRQAGDQVHARRHAGRTSSRPTSRSRRAAHVDGRAGRRGCAARAFCSTEDNEINQQIAVELLEGAGATVDVANNGREAVEMLSSGPTPPPFDVVLMDLQMPEMDGYQATAKLRSDARFAALPIIAMTAHATLEERQRCLAAGMNDHVAKPIDPDNLFETVGRFYRRPDGDTARGDTCRHGRTAAGGAASMPGRSTARTDSLVSPATKRCIEDCFTSSWITGAGRRPDPRSDRRRRRSARRAARAHAQGRRRQHRRHAGARGRCHTRTVDSPQCGAADDRGGRQTVTAALNPLLAELRSDAGAAHTGNERRASASATRRDTLAAARSLSALLNEMDPGAADFVDANQVALRPLMRDARAGFASHRTELRLLRSADTVGACAAALLGHVVASTRRHAASIRQERPL